MKVMMEDFIKEINEIVKSELITYSQGKIVIDSIMLKKIHL